MLDRFTSPDSIIPDPGSVIGHNRFAYVNNNPMIYTDPSGHHIFEEDPFEDQNNSYYLGPESAKKIFGVRIAQRVSRKTVVLSSDFSFDEQMKKIKQDVEEDIQALGEKIDNAVKTELAKPEYEPLLSNQYTPLAFSAISVFATDAMFLAMSIPHEGQPLTVGATYAIARATGLISLFATGYQYDHNLYGTTKQDCEIAATTTILSVVPKPDLLWFTHVGFLYTFGRTFGVIESP